MEFKPSKKSSALMGIKNSVLISMSDIEDMLQNEYLHDIKAHYIIKDDGFYDDSTIFQYGLAVDRIQCLQEAFLAGQTIVVKDIEFWNTKVKHTLQSISPSANAHLYVSPKGGTRLDWHTDDRDVYILMQTGEKTFEVMQADGSITKYSLKAGDSLFIPYGHKHKASASTQSGSVHIGVGVWPDDITIQKSYNKFDLGISLKF